jgi:hypothetical protein
MVIPMILPQVMQLLPQARFFPLLNQQEYDKEKFNCGSSIPMYLMPPEWVFHYSKKCILVLAREIKEERNNSKDCTIGWVK